MKLERVALVVHDSKPTAREISERVARFADRNGIEITDESPDLVMSVGGDGTMLRAAQLAHRVDAPVVGVNAGNLGYLPEIEPGSEEDALEQIAQGDMNLEERIMLRCSGPGEMERVALNEVLVERSSRHRLVKMSVRVSGEKLAEFAADGLIVATPTGSTAYALSAGGPLVSPRTRCIVLVPVSAHMIFSRPLVLSPDDVVEITMSTDGQAASIALDGVDGGHVPQGATVSICAHQRPLRMVRLSGPGFLQRLRAKLDLPAEVLRTRVAGPT